MDIHQQVTDRIIAALETADPKNWRCPWHRTGGGLPVNAKSGKVYRGINVLSLWCADQASGYGDSRWATSPVSGPWVAPARPLLRRALGRLFEV